MKSVISSPMSTASSRLCKTLIVPNELGLHARPASLLVRLTARYQAEVMITKDGEKVSGKSVIEVLMLAAEKGQELSFEVHGADAAEALAAIEAFFATELRELD